MILYIGKDYLRTIFENKIPEYLKHYNNEVRNILKNHVFFINKYL